MSHIRKSARLPEYDYSTPGAYLVSIRTSDQQNLFGRVVNASVQLSILGQLVEKCWQEIPEHFVNAELDKYVVMPDHFHGILVLKCRDTACRVQAKDDFAQPMAGSLSTIIRSFKSAVTRQARSIEKYRTVTVWQARFHERVIRKTENINKVREYILNNPLRWSSQHKNAVSGEEG